MTFEFSCPKGLAIRGVHAIVRAWPHGHGAPEVLFDEQVPRDSVSIAVPRRFTRVQCTATADGRAERSFLAPALSSSPQTYGLILLPAGSVVFTLADDNGTVLVDASVTSSTADLRHGDEAGASCENGGVYVWGVGGDSVLLEISTLSVGRHRLWIELPRSSETLDMGTIVLETEGSLEGRLILEDGTPLAGVSIVAKAIADDVNRGRATAHAVTGDRGEFEFRYLAATDYELRLDRSFDPLRTTLLQAPADGRQLLWTSPAALVEIADERSGEEARSSGV